VTEYLLRIFSADDPITGLLYPSVITNRPNIVLDVANEDCVGPATSEPAADRLQLQLQPSTAARTECHAERQ
jgi:hypothetical protein